MNYYNEHDPKKASWLRELIYEGVISPGVVDERPIQSVRPDDLAGFVQCHFFAGIGVWSYALRLAGWPDDEPVWTGSCPCQPFSDAGKGEAFEDPRHVWPAWFPLIEARRPVVVFGEQVASADGLAWLDLVRSDMDRAEYTIGCLDLCAAGFGAPHRRQRLFFVAHTTGEISLLGSHGRVHRGAEGERSWLLEPERLRRAGLLEYPDSSRREGHGLQQIHRGRDTAGADVCTSGSSAISDLEHAADTRAPVNGFWRDADWIYCRDNKWRAVEPGTFPLVDGTPERVLRLRGYGDAIVAPVAAEFIRAFRGVR